MKKTLFVVLALLLIAGLLFFFSSNAFMFVFRKKVWAHRVNSIEKKKEIGDKFSGIELDLVYNQTTGVFDVNHPPVVSINLSLADYLKADLNTNRGYWFDFKNLEESNAQAACHTMDSIVTRLGLNKNDIVVESQNCQYLKPFSDKGFSVSYYIPALTKMKKDSLARTVQDIQQTLNNAPYLCISSSYRDYELMKYYFPEKTKRLWWTGSEKDFWNWKRKIDLYKMMSDPTVKVLLVPFHPKFGDR